MEPQRHGNEGEEEVFMAVPLAQEQNTEKTVSPSNHNGSLERDVIHCYKPKHFGFGFLVGVFFFALVQHQKMLVLKLSTINIATAAGMLIGSALTALLWGVGIVVLAYGLFLGFVTLQTEFNDGGGENGQANERVWPCMECAYAVGIFLGFASALIGSFCRAGAPFVFVLGVVVTSMFWTWVMVATAETSNKENEEEEEEEDSLSC